MTPKLIHRGTLERRSTAKDSFGGPTSSWQTVDVLFMQMHPLTGSELERARIMFAEASHEIIARYRPDLVATMRIRYLGRILMFGYVENVDEEDRWSRILAKEVIGAVN